jgi:hypothetical protein
MYRRPEGGHHNWSEQKFELDKDLTGIVVKLSD